MRGHEEGGGTRAQPGACSRGQVRVLVAVPEGKRATVTAALRASPLVQVAGEAGPYQEVLAKARQVEPDVVAVDLSLFKELVARAAGVLEVDLPELTQRELEVLTLVAQSKTNKDIAAALYISENTVKNHVRNILEKLHLHSRVEAVNYAWQRRLLGGPPAMPGSGAS